MSARTNPLRQAMIGIQGKPATSSLTVVESRPKHNTSRTSPLSPSRIGKRAISGHFDPDVARQLRVLAGDQLRTVQDLLEEALNDLFRKHDKSAIAK